MKQIINIVINYENEEEVIQYAKTLSYQSASHMIVLIVVVNKSGKISISDLKKEFDKINIDVYVFNPHNNLGYLNGLIYGYDQYCKVSNSKPKWVIMSNTDIHFYNNNFLEDFINKKYENDIWCVAPSVYSLNKNSYENPQYSKRYTRKKLNSLIFIFKVPCLAKIYIVLSNKKSGLARKEKKDSQLVYSAHGSFFILKNEFADILRYKKYKALMYSEEAYIAEIVRDYDKKIFYDSTIEVIHSESTVTGKLDIVKKSSYIVTSLEIIRDEFFIDK